MNPGALAGLGAEVGAPLPASAPHLTAWRRAPHFSQLDIGPSRYRAALIAAHRSVQGRSPATDGLTPREVNAMLEDELCYDETGLVWGAAPPVEEKPAEEAEAS